MRVNFVEQIQESDLCETNTEPRKSTATGAQSKPGRVVAVAFDRQVSERERDLGWSITRIGVPHGEERDPMGMWLVSERLGSDLSIRVDSDLDCRR